MDISVTSDPDVSCVSTSSSVGFEITDIPGQAKELVVAKKKKFKFRGLEKSKKDVKNQISVDDFVIKKQEFSKWLVEEKKIQLSKVDEKRRKTLFKKFVNKWNKRKLPAEYYRETDSLWIVMSPFSPAVTRVKRSKSSVVPPRNSKTVTEKSRSPLMTRARCALSSSASIRVSKSVVESVLPVLSPCLPSTPTRPQFGTFGKKAGARLLAKLRINETWCNEKLAKQLAPERNTTSCTEDSRVESRATDMEPSTDNSVYCSDVMFSTFQPPQRSRGRRAHISSIFPECKTVL